MEAPDGPCRNLRSRKIILDKRKVEGSRNIIPDKQKAETASETVSANCEKDYDVTEANTEIPFESDGCEFSLHTISSSSLQGAYTVNSDRKQNVCGFQYKSDIKCEFFCNFCQFQCSKENDFLQHINEHIFQCHNCDYFCYNQTAMFCHQQECDDFSFNIEGFFLCTLQQNSIQTTAIDNFRVDTEIVVSEDSVKKEIESTEASCMRKDLFTNVQDKSEKQSCSKKLLGADFVEAFLHVKKEQFVSCNGQFPERLPIEAEISDANQECSNVIPGRTAIQGLLTHIKFT